MKIRISALLLSALVLGSCKPEKSSSNEPDGTPAAADQTASITPDGSLAITAKVPSPHFLEVMSHIDVGGKVLHYNDHEGRREFWIGLAELVMDIAESQGELDLPASFDVAKFIDQSGLMDVAATGRSISRDGDDWLMKQFSLYQDEPSEMAGLMGKAKPFVSGKRLPADTDLALEMQLNATSLPAGMRQMAKLMGQAEEIEEALATELPMGMTLETLYGLAEGHLLLGLELKDTGEEGMPVMPGDWVMQLTAPQKLVTAMQSMIGEMMGAPKAIGDYQGWEMPEAPMPGMGKPVMVVKGKDTMIIASSTAYLAKLDSGQDKLGDDMQFKSATNHFPEAGNLLFYLSPEVPAAAQKWMKVVTADQPEMEAVAELVRKITPSKPWSLCLATEKRGVHLLAEMPFALDANSTTMAVALGGTSTLFVGARAWKKGADRSAVILNIRNCQQAMRGEQNMKQLNPGDPFTRADLEEYVKFPEDIKVDGGWIRFEAGDKITPESGNPATNDDHIWLKVTGPGMDGVVGTYGFSDISEVTGW